MEEHKNENLSWCKPYIYEDDSGSYYIIMYEGAIESIVTPEIEAQRYDGSLTDDLLETIARRFNPDYDWYKGWSDTHIIMDSDDLREAGCSECPFKRECDAMLEEMGETDYR